MENKITIKGAREHNLKNISLELPRNKMIVFTGLSGSGKSSLAFDTIFAEGQRRYIESLSSYARQFLGGMSKPDVDEIEGLSPAISIDQKAHSANPRSTVATITEIYDYLRVLFARVGRPDCPLCGTSIEKITIDEMVERVRSLLSTGGGEYRLLSPVVRGRKGEYYQMLYDMYNSGFMEVRVDGKIKSLKNRITLSKLKKHNIDIIIDSFDDAGDQQRLAEAIETAVDLSNGLCTILKPDGSEQTFSTEYSCPLDGYSFPEIEPRLFSFNSPFGQCPRCTGLGTEELFGDDPCPKCEGRRLNDNALAVKVNGKNIFEVTSMVIVEAKEFVEHMKRDLDSKSLEISGAVFREVGNRLNFMLDVGLDYLTLDRRAGTLSGGEAQRIRLASQVGTKLVGALYVLDEPTIGLHQKDNAQLVHTLRNLCDVGNTIIIVEHDEDTILTSDWIVDIGPGAGTHGGEVVYSGPVENILELKSENKKYDCSIIGNPKKSLTGAYLRGEKSVALPEKKRKVDSATPQLKIRGATEHNLKNIDVDIPLRRFVCLTGVSGSGKSTLMHDILYRAVANRINHVSKKSGMVREVLNTEYVDKIIKIDQKPIGRTPRSNPATYTKAYDHIRSIFAETAEARIRGYRLGRFSFNTPGGRCENCEGRGTLTIEMHFLPSVEIICDVCRGKRFDHETLQVHYDGKNISEVLEMTIEEAGEFFRGIAPIYDKLKVLNEVGLGYLTLGQSATTLSGGEAQRIKLSRELSKRNTAKTLYLLDEPTTGLHYDDVNKLIDVIQKLVGQGNTVMVIEHNLDVIKCADWIIDMGPDGGSCGGQIVATGTPEELAKKSTISHTGRYLKKCLK
jgi:excinuclease ABC subunit A